MANNKPRIKINRKSIDELDLNVKKDPPSQKDLEKVEVNDPFSRPEEKADDSNPFDNEIIDEVDEPESPFIDDDEPTYTDNPFETDTQDYNENYETVETPYESPSVSSSPNVDLIIDPEMPYFFVFGLSTAGKSAMLSGLLYYIQTSRIGQLRSLGINGQINHEIGEFTLNEMTQKVIDGEFVLPTNTMATANLFFPTEINLDFQPFGKQNMPFCLLEMAGEDLKKIQLKNGGRSGGKLASGINAYLEHPACNLKFICVVDVDKPKESQELINQFLRYVYKSGHTNNPVLVTVNKWDKIADQYSSVKEYLEEKLPLLTNNLFDNNRDMAYMKFSIGKVRTDSLTNKDSYKFQPEDSRKLLDWMYETATGQSLNEQVETSAFSKILKSIKNMFSNE